MLTSKMHAPYKIDNGICHAYCGLHVGKLQVVFELAVCFQLPHHSTSCSDEQGFARHSRNDVFKLLSRDMEALSGMLGKSRYITGDKPCPQDCAVFAVLDVYLNSKIIEKDPLRDLVLKHDNLVSYVSNMQKELYPEDNPSQFKRYKI